MRQIWPASAGHRELGDAEVEELYRYPADPRWLAMNFVSSADGAVAIEGKSAGLSTPSDRFVFRLGSDLADVLLLGSGTAVQEEFTGVHPDERTADRRRRHGLSEVPPIAIVTTGDSLPADAPVLTTTLVPSIVLTCASAPESLRADYRAAGAEVLVFGEEQVDLAAAVAALVDRGLGRIDCEGGPHLFGSLLRAGVIDELRLTVAPMLVSGTVGRIATGAGIDPARLTLDSALLAEDSTLLLRYLLD